MKLLPTALAIAVLSIGADNALDSPEPVFTGPDPVKSHVRAHVLALKAKTRKDRYIKRLEKAVHAQATRAERNERRLRKARGVFRRALGSDSIGKHPYETAFLCIHGHEGAWTSATGNGYYGGLQMDRSFMRSYGGWALRAFGTANRWPVSVQIAVAIRALTSGRGFYPWPNTARMCGLI